jgi:TonB family protein
MLASWMLYASVIGLLIGAAAVSAERVFRDHHLPTRWIWCASLLITLTLPVVSRLLPEDSPATVADVVASSAATGALQQALVAVRAQAHALFAAIETFLLRGWGLGSFLLFTLAGLSILRLRQAKASWREDRVDDTPVLVSSDIGPAVLGVFRHRIVLPAWVLSRDAEARGLILAHEREHVRARDPLLVVASALPSLLAPWHLPLWWQYRRLRLAVEMDCDERVLSRAAPGVRRRYGHLLLEVGRRKSGVLALAAPFAEERSFLGRRISGLAEAPPAHPVRRAALLTTAGLLLGAAAWAVPRPAVPASAAAIARADAVSPASSSGRDAGLAAPSYQPAPEVALVEGSTAVASDVGPVAAALDIPFLPALEPASVVALAVEEMNEGSAADVDPSAEEGAEASTVEASDAVFGQVQASGQSAEAPQEGAASPAFPQLTPAYAERPLPNIGASSFQLEFLAVEETEDFAATSGVTPISPQLLNADEIQKQMVRRYPSHLIDAGIGGTVVLDFLVDESGMPAAWQIVQSSGHPLLDEAALRMASTFRFSPARTRRDQVVPVWTRFPIRFQVLH